MTFEELCQIEPRLLALYRRAQAVKDDKRKPSFCANRVWYTEFKPELCRLVGWEAENPALRTEEAYDLAYDTIYDVLPPCRNCWCL